MHESHAKYWVVVVDTETGPDRRVFVCVLQLGGKLSNVPFNDFTSLWEEGKSFWLEVHTLINMQYAMTRDAIFIVFIAPQHCTVHCLLVVNQLVGTTDWGQAVACAFLFLVLGTHQPDLRAAQPRRNAGMLSWFHVSKNFAAATVLCCACVCRKLG
jgi:hypothetical protein